MRERLARESLARESLARESLMRESLMRAGETYCPRPGAFVRQSASTAREDSAVCVVWPDLHSDTEVATPLRVS